MTVLYAADLRDLWSEGFICDIIYFSWLFLEPWPQFTPVGGVHHLTLGRKAKMIGHNA